MGFRYIFGVCRCQTQDNTLYRRCSCNQCIIVITTSELSKKKTIKMPSTSSTSLHKQSCVSWSGTVARFFQRSDKHPCLLLAVLEDQSLWIVDHAVTWLVAGRVVSRGVVLLLGLARCHEELLQDAPLCSSKKSQNLITRHKDARAHGAGAARQPQRGKLMAGRITCVCTPCNKRMVANILQSLRRPSPQIV